MRLTPGSLDRLTAGMVARAEENLKEYGNVATALLGHRSASDRFTFIEAPSSSDLSIDTDTGFIVVPGPLRENCDLIRDLFTVRSIQAATLIAEFWTYPDDEQDAALNYVAGNGCPPSAHPRRREGVIVATMWPLGGYQLVETRRIVRTPPGAYLRPWDNPLLNRYRESPGMQAHPEGSVVLMTSWLEECLPQRG